MSGRSRAQLPRNLRDGLNRISSNIVNCVNLHDNLVEQLRGDMVSNNNSQEIVHLSVDYLLYKVASDLQSKHPSLEMSFIESSLQTINKLLLRRVARPNVARQFTGRPISDFDVTPNLIFVEAMPKSLNSSRISPREMPMQISTSDDDDNASRTSHGSSRRSPPTGSEPSNGGSKNSEPKSTKSSSITIKPFTSTRFSEGPVLPNSQRDRESPRASREKSHNATEENRIEKPRQSVPNSLEESNAIESTDKSSTNTTSDACDPDIIMNSYNNRKRCGDLLVKSNQKIMRTSSLSSTQTDELVSRPTSTMNGRYNAGMVQLDGPLAREANNLRRALELTFEEDNLSKGIDQEKRVLRELRMQIAASEKKLCELRKLRQDARQTKINLCSQIAVYEQVSDDEGEGGCLVDMDAETNAQKTDFGPINTVQEEMPMIERCEEVPSLLDAANQATDSMVVQVKQEKVSVAVMLHEVNK